MKFLAVSIGILAMAGCATQDQLRQTEQQQGQVVQALRADAGRSESSIADLRSELRRTQQSVQSLEVSLAEARTRADAARTQADTALATSREFLDSLLAAREEQRRQLDESGRSFAELRRRTAELDQKLQAQQRLVDQSIVVYDDVVRRLIVVENGLQEEARRTTGLEARAKTGQETDDATTRQLVVLRKQVEDTRSAISSEGLLQLMRGLEDVRRNSASLRGSIDELQKSQSDIATQIRNYYVDLDARLRLLKQENAANSAAAQHAIQQESAPKPAQDSAEASPPASGQPVSQ
ncbi:MAG TPA: YbgF trimerization domain-containing protein [Burkholderiales bacterium]|nr:YbgF trimerization domain-containing protein [Burkholderiales bacterium]